MRSPWFQPLRARLDCMLLMVERHPKICVFLAQKMVGYLDQLVNQFEHFFRSSHHTKNTRIRGFPSLSDSLTGGDSVGRGAGISWDWDLYPMGIQYLNITHISHISHPIFQESFQCDLRITLVKNFTSQSDEAHRRVRLRSCCEQLLVEARVFFLRGPSDWWTPLGWFFQHQNRMNRMVSC